MKKSNTRPYRLSRNVCLQVNGYLRTKDHQRGSSGLRTAQLSAPSLHPSLIQPVTLHCHIEKKRAKKLPKRPVFTFLVHFQANSMQIQPQCTVFNLTHFDTHFFRLSLLDISSTLIKGHLIFIFCSFLPRCEF